MTDRPIRSYDDLLEIFVASCRSDQLVGVEAEKFGVFEQSGEPLQYEGERGVLGFFHDLVRDHGWHPLAESGDGPIIALERKAGEGRTAQITLEPGGQLELSGAPLSSVHAVEEELDEHFAELERPSRERGVCWLGVGFHPLARQDQLSWVPKARYRVMREYFPTRGTRGLDMMRRTATVQVNVDFASEEDAMRKLRVALKLAPVVTAMFANSPFYEGRLAGKKCERAAVWLDADPDRTGLLPSLLREGAGFRDYADWALGVPMYLFKRNGDVFANTGQTFGEFWRDGFQGERPTVADWKSHLATLFPEARLKTTIELRSVDALPRPLMCALPALWAGLLYDEASLDAVERIVAGLAYEELERCRPDVAARGLEAQVAGRPLRAIAEEIVDLANAGLGRRGKRDAAGRDETRHLEPLVSLVSRGRCPADDQLEGLSQATPSEELRREILRRTELTLGKASATRGA